MKLLALDIETRANLIQVETYDVYQDIRVQPENIIRPVEMVSFAYKWIDAEHLNPQLWPVGFWSKYTDGRKKMLRRLWDLLDEADVVLHYNGERFDIPHIQRELAEKGYNPPSPFKQIDLYKTAKRVFRFPMNKLAYVAPALGLEQKIEHEGIMSLIRRCEKKEPDALQMLEEYNVRDVELLEQLYYRIQPWIPNHPNRGGFQVEDCCRVCGSSDLQRRGKSVTRAGLVYPRYQCKACGAWSQGKLLRGSPTIKAVS